MDRARVRRHVVILVFCVACLAVGTRWSQADAITDVAESVDITGRATDEQGKPVGGATVYLASTNLIGRPEPFVINTTSAADGTYEFRRVTLPMNRGKTLEARFEVFGTALGYGFTWQGSRAYRPISAPADLPADERGRVFYKHEPITTELNFALPAAVSGRIVDDAGNPLAGARIELGVIYNELSGKPTWNCYYLELNPRRIHREDRSFGAMWLLPQSSCTAETDADGNFMIVGLPREASLIGRISYRPGYEEKKFTLATTVRQWKR
jgi:hypothetical protein